MIIKSYLFEKNVSLLDKYFAILIYGENIGMKDDIKMQIKEYLKNYEKITFTQDEILKKNNILTEQIENISLFNDKKVIFIIEASDKIKDLVNEILEKENSNIKIFLFASNLEKRSTLRKIFEKSDKVGIAACYQDNDRTLSEYVRKKLEGYAGLTQQVINFLVNNSGFDRKTLSHEINKIKSFFLDKKINFDSLPELLNNNNNLDFNNVRDSCLGGDKEELNRNLGNIIFQSENSYFYLGILANRIEKLTNISIGFEKEKSIEKAIDKLRPPIFWKDKPIIFKQMKKWNLKKLNEAKKIIFEAELQIRVNTNLNNNILIKNLIVNLYNKASSIS